MLPILFGLNACGRKYTNIDKLNVYLSAEADHKFSERVMLPMEYDIPFECAGSKNYQICNNRKSLGLLTNVLMEYNIKPVSLKESDEKKLEFWDEQKYVLISLPYTVLHLLSLGTIPYYMVEAVHIEYIDGDYVIEKEIPIKSWHSILFNTNYDVKNDDLIKGGLKMTINQAIKDKKIQ